MNSLKFRFCRFYSVLTFLMVLFSLRLIPYFLDHYWVFNYSSTDRVYYEYFIIAFIISLFFIPLAGWANEKRFNHYILLTPSILILGLLVNHPSDVGDMWFLITVIPFISLYGLNLILNWMLMGQINLWVRDDSGLRIERPSDQSLGKR